jgi:hypothetical protein
MNDALYRSRAHRYFPHPGRNIVHVGEVERLDAMRAWPEALARHFEALTVPRCQYYHRSELAEQYGRCQPNP